MRYVFDALEVIIYFKNLPQLAVAAAECVCSFSVCTLLQTQLFQAGVLWQLLPHLFKYDYTLDEGGRNFHFTHAHLGVAHSDESNQQSILNKLALSSCEALSCLAGFRDGTPENDGVQNSLRAMLTPYVCRLMRDGDNHFVLKTLNSNLEDPYMIWNNGTRAELSDFVEKHRNSNDNLVRIISIFENPFRRANCLEQNFEFLYMQRSSLSVIFLYESTTNNRNSNSSSLKKLQWIFWIICKAMSTTL